MPRITQDSLKELDDLIDTFIPMDRLAVYPRNVFLVNLMRYYEDYIRAFLPDSLPDSQGLREGCIDALDSFHFSVLWIHKYCGADAPVSKLTSLNKLAYEAAFSIMNEASLYSKIWDLMGCLHRSGYVGELSEDKKQVSISYHDSSLGTSETMDQLLNSYLRPDMANSFAPLETIEELIKEAKPAQGTGDTVTYAFPKSQFKNLLQEVQDSTAHLWELPTYLNFGKYTLGQVRAFWSALLARTIIHCQICRFSRTTGGAIDSLVQMKSRGAWANEMSRLANLDYKVAYALISDLTFDYSLQTVFGKKRPSVPFTPFFEVHRNVLALSNQVVIESNPERNFWSLLDVIESDVLSDLKNCKEPYWISQLQDKFSSRSVHFFRNLPVIGKGKPSDLDVLVIDEKRLEGLVLQLKWIIAPDRINEISYLIGHLKKGVEQVEISLDWLASQQSDVASKTNLPIELIRNCRYYGVVLSKNCMGKGHIVHSSIPACSEQLMNWLLFEPHQLSFQQFWNTLLKQEFYPRKGVHFDEFDLKFGFGDLQFHAVNIGMQMKRPFDPKIDIIPSSTHTA